MLRPPRSFLGSLSCPGSLDLESRAAVLTDPIQSLVHRGGVVLPDGVGGATVLDGEDLPYPGQPQWVLDALGGVIDATERGIEGPEGLALRRYDCLIDIVRADSASDGMQLRESRIPILLSESTPIR